MDVLLRGSYNATNVFNTPGEGIGLMTKDAPWLRRAEG
jgi:hypothetical protein